MDRQRPPYERNEKDNTSTGIPHFESKYKVEQHIQNLGIPYTIIGPTSLMENLLSYSRAGLRQGQLALPLPPSTILQQIALENIAEFSTLVLERRNSFLGKRIDIASDELTGEQAAKILSDELVVGTGIDITNLHQQYPEVNWPRFKDWVKSQNWDEIRQQ